MLIIQLPTPLYIISDLTIYKDPKDTLQFNLYAKPTSSYQYVHADSHPPAATKRAITYAEALRVIRNCSDHQAATQQLQTLKHHFRDRGYYSKTINKLVNKVLNHKPIHTCQKQRIVFKDTYDHRRPTTLKYVTENWNLMNQNPKLKIIYRMKPQLCHKNPTENLQSGPPRNSEATTTVTYPGFQ